MIVITASGSARNGKDSFCNFLKDKLVSKGKTCIKINYADYLKYLALNYYGWNGQKDEVGRTLLQQLGTEKVRSRNPNFWVNTLVNLAEVVKQDFDYMIIGDCRFPNEVLRWSEEGYAVIPVHITRTNFENDLTPEQKNHPSETALNNFQFNYYISAENLDELEMRTDEFINELLGGNK